MSDVPFIVLVDDDPHSAHLLSRMLSAHGAPELKHYATATGGELGLTEILNDAEAVWPGLVLVDLKSHSGANLDFLARNQAMLHQKGIPLAVMSPPVDRDARQVLHAAGATAVFFRQAELEAYRREASAIVSFWARSQRLDAVGM